MKKDSPDWFFPLVMDAVNAERDIYHHRIEVNVEPLTIEFEFPMVVVATCTRCEKKMVIDKIDGDFIACLRCGGHDFNLKAEVRSHEVP